MEKHLFVDERFVEKAYVSLFNILDKQVKETDNNALDLLLKDMNLDMFFDKTSGNPEIYENFFDCVMDNYINSHCTDTRTAYVSSKYFLREYQKKTGIDLGEILKSINYDVFEETFQTL